MSEIMIYSDPHLGLMRKANMTGPSNALREDAVHEGLSELLGYPALDMTVFCLGDFFDRESNPEEVILRALPIAKTTNVILAGNHDISNREGKETSLRLLNEMLPGKILLTTPETPDGYTVEVDDTLFCFAPHVMQQSDYDSMIASLKKEAEQYEGNRILCLHCNYDISPEILTDTTLNLTEAQAYELLHAFHYILIGHVHTPAEHFEGRLKLIGSVFPTAFDNLDDKRALVYDTETGDFRNIETWSAKRGLYSGTTSELPTQETSAKYFDLLNDSPPGEAQKLAVQLFKAGAFGVRLRNPEREQQDAPQFTAAQFEKLTDSIEAELKESKPHLLPLWQELAGEGK